MDYIEFAKQFLQNTYQFQSHRHQKKINKIMQGETFVLSYILNQEGLVLPSEISNKMNISSARVAVILNSLENKGFIIREVDKSDRRRILVNLTQKGVNLAQQHNQKVINMTVRMLKLLGEHDTKEFVRITGRLAELISEITNDEQ